jgi:hypothetical protein
MPHAPPITFFLIWSPKWYLVRSTVHKAPHYLVFSTPCYLCHLRLKYLPQHPILEHPQPMFLNVRDQVSHPYEKQAKLQFCISQSSFFWIASWNTKDFAPNDTKHCLTSMCSYFFMNAILFCKGSSQIFKLFHLSNDLLSLCCYSSCILVSRHEHILSFIRLYSRPVSLLVANKASVSSFTACMHPPNIWSSA